MFPIIVSAAGRIITIALTLIVRPLKMPPPPPTYVFAVDIRDDTQSYSRPDGAIPIGGGWSRIIGVPPSTPGAYPFAPISNPARPLPR